MADLVMSGFFKRDYVWNIISKTKPRLSYYRLSDNYLRFYLKYIEPNKKEIENSNFNNVALSTLPAFDSIMGLQFENLVLANRKAIIKKLNISMEDVASDHPYFQRPQLRSKGCQIDYLIKLKSNILYVCEIKFSRNEVGIGVVNEVQEKIRRLIKPKGYNVIPVLIHINGIGDSVLDSGYFRIVDFGEIMQEV